MATTILITFLLAGIAYGHPDDDAYYGFGPNMFPDFPTKFNYFMPPPPPPPVFQPFPNFEPFRPVNPYVFPDINSDTMKNFVPAEGQHYVGVSSSSQSFSSNVNGVKTSGGKVSSLTNIDGNVDEQKLAFHKNDPPKP